MFKLKGQDTVWPTASYGRASHDDEDKAESDTIANQRDLIRAYINERADLAFVEAYEDDGWSGVNFDRPNFKRLMDDIRAGKIKCVVVKDLSRLGRNYIETGKLLERFFPFMGVRFIAINDHYDSLNPNNQTDSLIIPFKNLINDAYCADTSRKIKSQLEVKRKKGEFIGSFSAYGYLKDPGCKNRLIIDDTAAPVVRDIFRWKIEGVNNQGIANRLNERGVLSPLAYKKSIGSKYSTKFTKNPVTQWTPVAVGRVLQNELYTGVLTQGIVTTPNYKVKKRVKKDKADWIRVEQSHEPIISADDFKLVAALMKRDTRTAKGESAVYLFSGMLFCADCGQGLVRKNVPSGNNKYVYHVCRTFKKGGGCKSHSISETALYEAVFKTITVHIRQCVQISRILAFIEDMPFRQLDARKLQAQISGKQTELDKLKRRLVKLYEDFSDGILNNDEFVSFKEIFTRQTADAETAIANLNGELDTVLKNKGANCLWIEHFKKYQDMERLTRGAVVELIERITVYEGGRIKVRLHYQDQFESALRFIDSLPAGSMEKAVI